MSSWCLLTILTPTLVLLAWQKVSDFMPGPAGLPLTYHMAHSNHSGPIVLTACEWFYAMFHWVPFDYPHSTLVLLTWQPVSDSIPGHDLAIFWLSLLPLWSNWLDSLWVISCSGRSSWVLFQPFSLPPWSCWWTESEWCHASPGSCTSESWLSQLLLQFCWLDRKWVILC